MSCYYRDGDDDDEDDMSFGGHSAYDEKGADEESLDFENVAEREDGERKVYHEHGYDDMYEDDDADSYNESPKEPTGYHIDETTESVAYSGSNDPLNSTVQEDNNNGEDYGKHGDYGDYSRYGEYGDYSGESVPSISGDDSKGNSNRNYSCSPWYTSTSVSSYTKASRGSIESNITSATEEEEEDSDYDEDERAYEIYDPYLDLMASMERYLEQRGPAYNIRNVNLSQLVNKHEHEREG